ncbi:MAG TPA: type II toxin-antitoxin system Phd/YefM family antitoxin [Stellaceae bacterium]|nr:type II toxin-antitoxin system Phd/YefM family antitoxin [Stellaceae bacterium]
MRTVGFKVLKKKLSEYVRIAASGERVQVTDRNRVVAELLPPHAERTEKLLNGEEFLEREAREGRVRLATLHGAAALPPRHR